MAACVVTAIAVWNLKPAPARPALPVSRLVIPLPPTEQLTGTDGSMLALSADGTQLAYVAGSTQRIYLRAFDTLEAKPLTGTEGALSPFFSPDGQWIGFFAGSKLKKVAVSGGAVLTLCDAGNNRGGAWGANDTIVFAPNTNVGLSQVSAAGGAPQPLTKLKEGENGHRWPQFLPDGKSILYGIGTSGNPDDGQIAAYRLDTGEQKILIRGGTYSQYVPTGHLVYYRAGTIMAVPFDAARLEMRGTPAPAIEGVMAATANTGGAQFSFSSMGSLVYVPGQPKDATNTLVWVDRKGIEQPLPAPAHAYIYPRISPDGRRVALTIAEADRQLWIYDFARETLTRFTFDGNGNQELAWSPDGKRIAFSSNKEGAQNIFWQMADGSGGLEQLTTSKNAQRPRSFSPDGQLLTYVEANPSTGNDVWVLHIRDHKAQPFLQSRFSETVPSFSPDGHWLSYMSDESGRPEVYVQAYPGPGGKFLISIEGGTEPVWNPNGKELFFRIGDAIVAANIVSQPAFSAGKPQVLFRGPYRPTGGSLPWYDVSPDGQRFLMLKPKEQQTALTQITVVQNWFEELQRRVPTGKQ